jgi:hypothetical protein
VIPADILAINSMTRKVNETLIGLQKECDKFYEALAQSAHHTLPPGTTFTVSPKSTTGECFGTAFDLVSKFIAVGDLPAAVEYKVRAVEGDFASTLLCFYQWPSGILTRRADRSDPICETRDEYLAHKLLARIVHAILNSDRFRPSTQTH